MNKYQEAYDKIYWANPNRYDYTDEHLMLQELVDRFGNFDELIKKQHDIYVYQREHGNYHLSPSRTYDYFDGALRALEDLKKLLKGQSLDWEKEGK